MLKSLQCVRGPVLYSPYWDAPSCAAACCCPFTASGGHTHQLICNSGVEQCHSRLALLCNILQAGHMCMEQSNGRCRFACKALMGSEERRWWQGCLAPSRPEHGELSPAPSAQRMPAPALTRAVRSMLLSIQGLVHASPLPDQAADQCTKRDKAAKGTGFEELGCSKSALTNPGGIALGCRGSPP